MEKTYWAKKEEVTPSWWIVDLDGKILGRVATRIATILRGKHKPTYTPSVISGDFVVAINAAKIKLTGTKLKDKKYYSHSGFRGGFKEVTAGELFEKKPEELIRKAVNGMLPNNKSRKHIMKKFKIYAGAEHPHAAQQPKNLEV